MEMVQNSLQCIEITYLFCNIHLHYIVYTQTLPSITPTLKKQKQLSSISFPLFYFVLPHRTYHQTKKKIVIIIIISALIQSWFDTEMNSLIIN